MASSPPVTWEISDQDGGHFDGPSFSERAKDLPVPNVLAGLFSGYWFSQPAALAWFSWKSWSRLAGSCSENTN